MTKSSSGNISTPYHPCIVDLPTFTIKMDHNVGKYTIHGWYGNRIKKTNNCRNGSCCVTCYGIPQHFRCDSVPLTVYLDGSIAI